MSMYVRVKRAKLTVFLHVDPTDTIAQLKEKLQELVQQPAADQRLYKDGVLLEEDKSLADLKVENDDELAVVYRLEGSAEFEAVNVERYDSGMAATKEEGV